MAKSAAVKRLERILFDVSPEEYGPKLFRLSKKDQDYILGRIERNENAQVTRREILRLDKERLERNRERRIAKRTPKLPTIEELRRDARRKLHSQWKSRERYNATNTRMRVNLMNEDELQFAIDGSTSELESRASEPSIAYPDLDIELNVFWYH